MNKELLEKRVVELANQRDQLIAQANAIAGAMDDCKYWLDELAKISSPEMK